MPAKDCLQTRQFPTASCVCYRICGFLLLFKIFSDAISNAVIQETLRFHPNTGTIIERQVPKEGAVIDGYTLPGGTVVGVNAWVLHRDAGLFGDDADSYRPERWIEASRAQRIEMERHLFTVRS